MDVVTAIVLGLWGAFAISVVMRLRRRGASTFTAPMSPADRRLIGMAAFYLAVPAIVLGAQLLQVLALHLFGNALGHAETAIYWGSVEPAHPEQLTHLGRAGIAAIGPVTLCTVSCALLAWTAWRPGQAAWNALRVEVGRLLLMLGFGLYPLVGVIVQRGDVWAFREALEARHAQSGDVALLGYGILGAYAFFRWRRAHGLRLLASPVHDDAREAATTLLERPDDPDALRALGHAQRTAGDPRALDTLKRASALRPDHPAIQLELGRALLQHGAPADASNHLRHAGQLLEEDGEDEDLLLEVTLALSAARIALGDAEGARLTAEAAHRNAPGDPRACLMLADALVAGGERDQAREQLERGLESADGSLQREIEARLDQLRRRR